MIGSVARRASLFSSSVAALSTLTAANATEPELAEVVVTAQQRSENIQTVPITIQAFTEEKLASAGVTAAEGLPMVTPGLVMARSGNTVNPFIRGIGTSGQGDSAVAQYVDGVYYLGATNTNSLANIERVEVLKGPQGTLFGRNTTGGLIHIITKEPTRELSGNLSLSGGTYGTVEGRGFLSGGITDTIAASVSGFVRQQGEGFGRNLLIGGRASEWDERSGRGKLQYKTDDTKITLIGDYADVEDSRGYTRAALPGAVVGIPNEPDTWSTFIGNWHDINNAALPQTSPPHLHANGLSGGSYTRRDWGGSLTIEHHFDGFDAISISAYRDAKTYLFGDNDFGPEYLAQANVDFRTKYVTQEARLTSRNNSRFSWIVGAFFLDSDDHSYLEVPTVIVGDIYTKSYSAFAEGALKFFDDAGTLTVGGRYTIDKRRVSGSLGGNPYFGVAGIPLPPPGVDPATTWKEPTYRIVYSHQVRADFMAYASYNRGFKSGNYNVIPATTPPYNPEIMNAYEVGFKSALADGRIRLNMAAWYYDYNGLQLQVATNISTATVNAAGAKIKGIEEDLSARVTDELTFDLGATYIDGKYTNFRNAQVYAPNVNAAGQPVGGDASISIDASGKPLIRTPKFMASPGLTYRRRVGNGDLIGVVRAQYSSRMSWEPSDRLTEDPRVLVNASIGYESNAGWGLRVEGANIFNVDYALSKGSTNFGDYFSAADPATVMATVSYKF